MDCDLAFRFVATIAVGVMALLQLAPKELPLPEQPSVFLPTPTWVFPTATMTLEPTATATPVSRVPLLWSILATLFFAFAATTLVLTILFALYLNRVRRATDVAQKQALAWQHLATTLSRRERRNSNGKKGPKGQRTFRDDWLAARPTFREPGEAPVPEPFSFAEEHVAFPIVKASSSGLEHGQPDLPHNDQGRLGSTPGVVPSSALPLHSAFGGDGVGPDARNASEEAGHDQPEPRSAVEGPSQEGFSGSNPETDDTEHQSDDAADQGNGQSAAGTTDDGSTGQEEVVSRKTRRRREYHLRKKVAKRAAAAAAAGGQLTASP